MTQPISSEEVEQIATAAAEKALRHILLIMGLNIEDKNELLAAQKDFAHLRKWRLGVDAITVRGMMVATGAVIMGVLGAVYAALQGRH